MGQGGGRERGVDEIGEGMGMMGQGGGRRLGGEWYICLAVAEVAN